MTGHIDRSLDRGPTEAKGPIRLDGSDGEGDNGRSASSPALWTERTTPPVVALSLAAGPRGEASPQRGHCTASWRFRQGIHRSIPVSRLPFPTAWPLSPVLAEKSRPPKEQRVSTTNSCGYGQRGWKTVRDRTRLSGIGRESTGQDHSAGHGKPVPREGRRERAQGGTQ